jgi:response regulator of citrate/malate metabolism
MPSWRVLIVEDDRDVAFVHRELVSRVASFQVVGVAATGEEVLQAVKRLRPDLILLDLALPGMDGLSVLRELRGVGSSVEVIAVTARRDAETVRSIVHLGTVDYLVKPFTPERLRQALLVFLHRMAALGRVRLDQHAIDEASGRVVRRSLPRGLTEQTLDDVRAVLARADHGLSADEAAAATGVARVTARRYLEYLVTTTEATVELVAIGAGRPRRAYRPARLGAG